MKNGTTLIKFQEWHTKIVRALFNSDCQNRKSLLMEGHEVGMDIIHLEEEFHALNNEFKDLNLEYIELRDNSKIISNENNDVQLNSYEEFILQKFQDNLGNFENQKEYECRVAWFNNSCPTYKELSKITGININSICSYASKYNWSDLKNEAFDLGYRKSNDSSINHQNLFIDTTEKVVKRNSKEYAHFRESVLKRDNVCQCCGSNENLEVHHPMPFNQYNSLGADTNNGIVLCEECHSKYHSEYGYKRNANAVTLALFLRDYGMSTQSTLTDNNLNVMSFESVFKNIREFEEDHGGNCPITLFLRDCENVGFDINDIKEKIEFMISVGLCYAPDDEHIKTMDNCWDDVVRYNKTYGKVPAFDEVIRRKV